MVQTGSGSRRFCGRVVACRLCRDADRNRGFRMRHNKIINKPMTNKKIPVQKKIQLRTTA